MTDVINAQPLWLAQVRDSQRVIAEGIEVERQKREAAEQEKERKERERKLVQFEASLRAVLGDEAADELLGGPYAQAKELFILSGDYKFSHSDPQRVYTNSSIPKTPLGGDKNVQYTYAIRVSRQVPAEIVEYMNDRDHWCDDEVTDNPCVVSSMAGVTIAITEVDKAYARLMTEYTILKDREDKRKKIEVSSIDAAPVSADPVKPTLSYEDQQTVSYLADLKNRLEWKYAMTVEQTMVVSVLRWLISRQTIDW